MKLSIPTTELKNAIAGLGKVISTKANLPILSHVRLDADGKSVTLTGTDLNQVATYAIVCETPLTAPVSTLIPFDAIQTALKAAQGPVIEIETGKDAVTISYTVAGQSIGRRVETLNIADWPMLPKPAETKPVEQGFLGQVRQAMVFASSDDSRALLKSVYLDVDAKSGHKVVATDSRRLSVFPCGILPLSESAIVPASKFLGWAKLAGETRIGADKVTFTLNAGPWTYSVKLVAGTFPRYAQVIPSFGKDATLLELSPEDAELLVKALPSMPSFDNATDAVVLRLAPNAVRVCSRENAKAPEAVIRLEKSKCIGTAVSVGLDRRYFRDALVAGFRLWEVRDSTSPLVGHLSKDDAHSCHVLMPVRCVNLETEPPNAATVEAPVQAAKPIPGPTQPQETQKETPMPKKIEKPQTVTTEAPTSLDRILSAYELAKDAVRQANTALADVAQCVRDAIKEDRARRKEISDVRSGLAKLQAIRV